MILGLSPVEALAALLLAAALFFTLAAVVGILRLPDFYTRLHAVAKCDTAGLSLAVLALALLSGDPSVAIKLLLVCLFVAVAGPTATHAIGRAALRRGVPVWRNDGETVRDQDR